MTREIVATVVGTPPGLREVHFERGGTTPETGGSVTASWDGEGWSATLYMNGTPDPDGLWIKGRLPDGKAWWHRGAWSLWAAGSSFTIKQDEWAWCAILPDQVYESGVVLVRARPITGTEPGASPVRAAFELLPADLPWPVDLLVMDVSFIGAAGLVPVLVPVALVAGLAVVMAVAALLGAVPAHGSSSPPPSARMTWIWRSSFSTRSVR